VEINATIILQIFIFSILLLWLSRTLFAPILKLFDERERRITGAMKEALSLNDLAQKKAEAFDEQYQQARNKARESLSLLNQKMEKEHQEILQKAKLIAKAKVNESEEKLKLEENIARPVLLSQAQTMAQDIIKTLVKA
jgi:F-type H+-transporting ATPase subunit b